MSNILQSAGAATQASEFAPLHTNRIFTGYFTNRSALRDGAVTAAAERAGYGRQDSIWDGLNTEISTRLTLIRRPGNTVYNSNSFAPIISFYSFNTFTLSSEAILVLADTATQVIDVTGPGNNGILWTKSTGAGRTYFCSIGNNLYFTNGVDNCIYDYTTGNTYPWGVDGPANAPLATQQPRPNPYPAWAANTAYASYSGPSPLNFLEVVDSNGNLERWGPFESPSTPNGQIGPGEPVWQTALAASTPDGTINWTNEGPKAWQPRTSRAPSEVCVGAISGMPDAFFVVVVGGPTATIISEPNWASASGTGQQIQEGSCIWQNMGPALHWSDLGDPSVVTDVTYAAQIVDPNGYLQTIYQMGKTGATTPTPWGTELGSLTISGSAIFINSGPFAVPGSAPIQYGYAYENSNTKDISNMSPPSNAISVIQGNEVQIVGDAPTQAADDTVVLYRIPQGGSTFLYLTSFPAPPPGGAQWNYLDHAPDSDLNPAIQAQVNGEGTPLPPGASCIEYHLGRLFVAVGNVVYVATGPDAIASGSNGQAGFGTTFTAQSKIIRFWVTSLGLIVFTVRDSYIILGSATDQDPLYMIKYIPRLPLLNYDCMTEQNTTAFLFIGPRIIVGLDPSSGIIEASFQISNVIKTYDPRSSYLTYHTEESAENALYLADGISRWNRMASTSAPESGSNWSVPGITANGYSAVQSVEVTPGVWRLLLGPSASDQHIRYRDLTTNLDDGSPYPAWTTFGSIVMASPGQLAALAFITLDSEAIGTAAALSVLCNEVNPSKVPFETVKRTRQDPPLLPPSQTLYSDRFSLLQKQKPVWCRHFQMRIDWPPEDAANELIGFTIFGQIWQEYRSQ